MPQVKVAAKGIILDDNKILTITSHAGDVVFWDIPGGKMEFQESPEQTLHREIKEELNIEIEDLKLLGVWWFFPQKSPDIQIVCVTYVCKPKSLEIDFTKNPSTEEKLGEVMWLTKEEFLEKSQGKLDESLRKLIQEKL